jgi:hypothetical protein
MSGAGAPAPGERVVAWTAHPARRRPQDAMLAAFVVLIAAYPAA